MSEFRQGGAEQLRVLERVGDPAAVANQVQVYSKDVGAVSNLFARLSDGTVLNLTGGVTLDVAYDGGRTITADAGAVVITSSADDANSILEVTKTPPSARAGNGVTVTMGANSTGHGVSVSHTGASNGLGLDINRSPGVLAAARGLAVTMGANATGNAAQITNGGTGNALNVRHNAAGATFAAVDIVVNNSTLARALFIAEDASVRTVPLVAIARDAAATGILMELNNDGAGNAISVLQGGAAFGVSIALDTSTTNRALVITEDAVNRSNPMVQITRDAAVTNGNAHVIEIVSGATAADVLNINNEGGRAIRIDHGSSGDAISINLDGASTAGQAIVVSETAVARINPMMRLQRNGAATGDCIEIVDAGDGLSMDIDKSGAGDILNLQLTSDTTNQAIVITEDNIVRSAVMIDITTQVNRTGNVLQITNPGSGFSIDVVSGQVRFQTAQALGGGSSATLGTVGGSGPAAAAQNEWIELHTQNGTRFVPAWA